MSRAAIHHFGRPTAYDAGMPESDTRERDLAAAEYATAVAQFLRVEARLFDHGEELLAGTAQPGPETVARVREHVAAGENVVRAREEFARVEASG